MALITVNSKILTADESAGLQAGLVTGVSPPPATQFETIADTDIDDTSAALPTAFATRLAGLGTPLVTAEETGVITVDTTANVSNLALTQASGQPLNGVDSGLTTISGDHIFLYTDTNDNIVLGRVGTGSVANASGTIAFAIYLEETTTSGKISGGNLWLVEFQALHHTSADSPDTSEGVNLLNRVYVAATQDVSFTDFSKAPSGQNVWIGVDGSASGTELLVTGINPAGGDTVNTSTTGLGENAQHVDHLEGLRIDFVKGINQLDNGGTLTANDTHSSTGINYDQHVLATGGGWSPVQVNPGSPNTTVSALMAAFDATGDPQSSTFVDDLSQQTPKTITHVTVTFGSMSFLSADRPATIPAGGASVTGTGGVSVKFYVDGTAEVFGLKTNYLVEFNADAPIDRFTVTNTTSQTNRSFDIGNIHVLSTSSETAEVGSHVQVLDDGPTVGTTGTLPTLTVDETNLAIDDTKSFAANFTSSAGVDGLASTTFKLAVTEGASSGLTDTLSGQAVTLHQVSDTEIQGIFVSGATTFVVFDVTVNSSGSVMLDQSRAVVHSDPSNPNDTKTLTSADLVKLTTTIADGDGDSAAATLNIGQQLVFTDDAPSNNNATLSRAVQEDALNNSQSVGNGEVTVPAQTTTAAITAAQIAALVNAGADGLGLIRLANATELPDTTLTGLKSKGVDVHYHVVSATEIDGVAGTGASARVVFTLVQTPGGDSQLGTSDDIFTFTLKDQVDHATASGDSSTVSLDIAKAFVATDGDGDSTQLDNGATINIENDVPIGFTPDSITLTNTGTATGTEPLHAAAAVGADEPGSLAFIDTVAADNILRDTGGHTLKSGGANILMDGFGTATLTAFVDKDASGTFTAGDDTVFTATLNAGADTYTIDFDKAIDDGSGINFLGAAPVRSGNPTYNIIDNVGGTTLDLLFSAANTSGQTSVNVSTQGAGAGNQTMDGGETLRIDFETGASLAGSPSGSDFNAGTHQLVNGFSLALSQNTPSGTTGSMQLKAIDADNDKVLIGDPDDVVQQIIRVEIKIGSTTQVLLDGSGFHSLTVNGKTVMGTYAPDNKSVIITGLNEGTTGDTPSSAGTDDPFIKIFTANDHKFDAVEISNVSGQTIGGTTYTGTSFDIAPAGVDQTVQGTAFDFNLPVQLTDFDGDTSPIENIHVHLDPLLT